MHWAASPFVRDGVIMPQRDNCGASALAPRLPPEARASISLGELATGITPRRFTLRNQTGSYVGNREPRFASHPTAPITPPNCNASHWGHLTLMLAMNADTFSYSAAVIPLLAWISTRSPMAGLN